MIRFWRLLCLCLFTSLLTQAQDLPPGFEAGEDYASVPTPVARFQVYFLGEMHGAQETKSFMLGYLRRLHQDVGLRDAAIEEDQVYQEAARDYVAGRTGELPAALCLRADVLTLIRRFNASLPVDQRVQVHLVDLDSPMQAIREHLVALKQRLKADTIDIPDEASLRDEGARLVEQLAAFASDDGAHAELETVKSSIAANREGFESGTGKTKGDVLMEAREETITRNTLHALKEAKGGSLLVFYGSVHAMKKLFHWPPESGRKSTYKSLAMRLMEKEVSVFSVLCLPVAGRVLWRGQELDISLSRDFRLSDRLSMSELVAKAPTARFFWVDLSKASDCCRFENLTGVYDFMLLMREVTPMNDTCVRAQE